MSALNTPFSVSVKNGAQAQARKSGIGLTVEVAGGSGSTAPSLAATAISKKTRALIVDPAGDPSAASAVTRANGANIPVLAFGHRPAGGRLTGYVGYDATRAGRNAADALAKAIGGKGKVVEIQGRLDSEVARERSKGFGARLAQHPGVTVVARRPAGFDRSTALGVMSGVLRDHPGIAGVYAANDEMAMGALSALKARKLAGKVKLVGNDGISEALAAVAAGDMYATNAESPFALGQHVSMLTADLLAGEPIPASEALRGDLVTKDNLKKYAAYLVGIGDSADVPPSLR